MAKNITQMFRLNKNRTTGTYMRTAESLLCRFLVLDKYKVVVIRPSGSYISKVMAQLPGGMRGSKRYLVGSHGRLVVWVENM